jgi:hypothetical protein
MLPRLLLVLILTAACSGAQGNRSDVRDVRARVVNQPRFTAAEGSTSTLRRVGAAGAPHEMRLAARPGGFSARYALDTSGGCIAPHSIEHRIHADTVQVTLFSDRPSACMAVYTPEEYELILEGITAGPHVVRILVEEGREAPQVKLNRPLRIPEVRRTP